MKLELCPCCHGCVPEPAYATIFEAIVRVGHKLKRMRAVRSHGEGKGRPLDGMTSSLEWSSMVMMEAFLAGDISIDSPCEPTRFGAKNTMCVLMVLAQGGRQGR